MSDALVLWSRSSGVRSLQGKLQKGFHLTHLPQCMVLHCSRHAAAALGHEARIHLLPCPRVFSCMRFAGH